MEVGTLTKKVRTLEEDFEQAETRLSNTSTKLDEASAAADESERCVVVVVEVLYHRCDKHYSSVNLNASNSLESIFTARAVYSSRCNETMRARM